MGISDLNTLLREVCPHVFQNRSVNDFKGKRIAIDANYMCHRLMATAHKRNVYSIDVAVEMPDPAVTTQIWLGLVLSELQKLMIAGVTPVMIFDGVHPVKKAATQESRRKRYDDDAKAILDIRAEMASDILNKADLNRLRQLMSRTFGMSRSNLNVLREVMTGIGIPILEATDESEKLCSMLAIEGYVEAVLSADTDNLAYGCPLLIFEPTDSSARFAGFTSIQIRDVLAGLQLSYASFKDLCIMLGCDYNSNIPQIGTNRAYKLITKYGSIDRLPRLTVPIPSPSRLVAAIDKKSTSPNRSPVSGSPQLVGSAAGSPIRGLPVEKDLLDAAACNCGIPIKPLNGVSREYDIAILEVDYCRKQFGQCHARSLCVNWSDSLDFSRNALRTAKPIFEKYRIDNMYSRFIEIGNRIPPATSTEYRSPEPITFCIVGE